MNVIHEESPPCRRIAELLNELVDGDETSREHLDEARELVEKNPQCRALYQTLMKTVELYRMRRNEITGKIPSDIAWKIISEKAKEKDNLSL